jgi:hypothetical protein
MRNWNNPLDRRYHIRPDFGPVATPVRLVSLFLSGAIDAVYKFGRFLVGSDKDKFIN